MFKHLMTISYLSLLLGVRVIKKLICTILSFLLFSTPMVLITLLTVVREVPLWRSPHLKHFQAAVFTTSFVIIFIILIGVLHG